MWGGVVFGENAGAVGGAEDEDGIDGEEGDWGGRHDIVGEGLLMRGEEIVRS